MDQQEQYVAEMLAKIEARVDEIGESFASLRRKLQVLTASTRELNRRIGALEEQVGLAEGEVL